MGDKKTPREQGYDHGRAGRTKTPPGGSMTDAFVNPPNVDRASKDVREYKEGNKDGLADRKKNR